MQQRHCISEARDERPNASEYQQFADRQMGHGRPPWTFLDKLSPARTEGEPYPATGGPRSIQEAVRPIATWL